MQIDIYDGSRTALLPLFRLADESETEIRGYFQLGEVLVARDGGKVVGMAQVEKDGGTVQIISLAVLPERQREGLGRRLIEAAKAHCRRRGGNRLIVCTGAWEKKNIAFYERRGFRLFHVEKAYFTPHKGYGCYGDQAQFEMAV